MINNENKKVRIFYKDIILCRSPWIDEFEISFARNKFNWKPHSKIYRLSRLIKSAVEFDSGRVDEMEAYQRVIENILIIMMYAKEIKFR
jgi:hypothetical protein